MLNAAGKGGPTRRLVSPISSSVMPHSRSTSTAVEVMDGMVSASVPSKSNSTYLRSLIAGDQAFFSALRSFCGSFAMSAILLPTLVRCVRTPRRIADASRVAC